MSGRTGGQVVLGTQRRKGSSWWVKRGRDASAGRAAEELVRKQQAFRGRAVGLGGVHSRLKNDFRQRHGGWRKELSGESV